MARTLIGIFESFREADVATERLVQSGITRADIQTHATDQGNIGADTGIHPRVAPERVPMLAPLDGTSTRMVATPGQMPDQHGLGLMGEIERFFANIFGNDERPVELAHYHNAVQGGGTLLSVNVREDNQTVLVRSVLEGAGATHVELHGA